MKNIRKYTAWLGAGAIMITLATGCANKDGDAVPDSTENVVDGAADTTSNVAGAMGDTTENMVDAAGNNIAPVGDAMANGASAAGSNLEALGDAATMTPKIKTALGAAPALKGSEINVDTLGEKNTIALRGTVTSAAQKTLAESIAKQNAPGYTINNQLTMKGAM